MLVRLSRIYRQSILWIRNHRWLAFGLPAIAVVAVLGIVIYSTRVVAADTQYVLPATTNKQVAVGIVLGAGITKDGRPFKELQARLDVAAEALNRGTVKKLILSGDNSRKTYDEPTAMITYLTNTKHVDPSKLQPDYAGRSTYESCERAASIFNVKQTILFSAPSHLPRAIFLCRHFGIETYGISSGLDGNNAGRREPLARVKALYNVYVHGEPTILGKSITVN